jgi:hypothetical protein
MLERNYDSFKRKVPVKAANFGPAPDFRLPSLEVSRKAPLERLSCSVL